MYISKTQLQDFESVKQALFFASLKQKLHEHSLSTTKISSLLNALNDKTDHTMIALFFLHLLPVTYQDWTRKK